MNYRIPGRYEPMELYVWPSDEDAGEHDYWLNFMCTGIHNDECVSVDVLASELYPFIEWLKEWCPPFAEHKAKPCEHTHVVDTFDPRYQLCSDCGQGLRVAE